MSKKGAEFGIIVADGHQFSVWPMHREVPFGWFFSGLTGTQAEMEVLLLQRFVKTTPVTHITPDKRFRTSQWADTEGGSPMA